MQSIDIKMADDDDDDDESDDVQAACARGTTRTKQPWAERWLLSGLRLKRRRALQMRRVDQGGEEVYAYIKFDASKAKRTVKPHQLTGAS